RKEVYLEPVVNGDHYHFAVRLGKPEDAARVRAGTKLGRGSSFRCLVSGAPITGEYIMAQGCAGQMDSTMLAIVAEGSRERVFLSPTDASTRLAKQLKSSWRPDIEFFQQALGFRVGNYGM